MIIGLYGEMGSGKDTVAEILSRKYEYAPVSIGRFIREELAAAPVPKDTWVPNPIASILTAIRRTPALQRAIFAKPTVPDIRVALQWYGQYRYSQNCNYWLNMIDAQIKDLKTRGHKKFVFVDVRMPNEFHYAAQHGETWKIVRCSGVESMDVASRKMEKYGHLKDHITEINLAHYPFKMYLSNNGDLKDLEHHVDMIVKWYSL